MVTGHDSTQYSCQARQSSWLSVEIKKAQLSMSAVRKLRQIERVYWCTLDILSCQLTFFSVLSVCLVLSLLLLLPESACGPFLPVHRLCPVRWPSHLYEMKHAKKVDAGECKEKAEREREERQSIY